jgi:large subunit ribosomal protein L1
MSEDEVVQPVEGEGEAESEATEAVAVELEGAPKHRRIRHKPSKRHRKARAAVGSADPRPLSDAVQLLKGVTSAKFDESVELHLRLGVDTKKPDQQVRGTFAFPHGIGREKRVIAFAEGDMALECEAAGAVAVGGQDLAKKISDGWLDFDVVVAHPAMMRHIGRLGRVLGPRGLMPNPKAGTVTGNVPAAVAEFKAGKVEFRLDEGANIHLVVGKKSFEVNKLVENIEAFLAHLESVRPSGVRGTFMLRATVSSTMGPGVRVQISS